MKVKQSNFQWRKSLEFHYNLYSYFRFVGYTFVCIVLIFDSNNLYAAAVRFQLKFCSTLKRWFAIVRSKYRSQFEQNRMWRGRI